MNYSELDELEFHSALTWDCGVSCPWASGIITIYLQWETCCSHSSTFISFLDPFLAILIHILLICAISRTSIIYCVWSLFQVQSYLPLSIVRYGVSKQAGLQVSDRCQLDFLFLKVYTCIWYWSGTIVQLIEEDKLTYFARDSKYSWFHEHSKNRFNFLTNCIVFALRRQDFVIWNRRCYGRH